MKVFVNKKVYVQKNDLMYFMRGTVGQPVPASIIDKVFGEPFYVSDNNRYEFIEFSEPEEIDFFRNLEWIVDYNQFDGMNENQIIEYGLKIQEDRNKIAQSYNILSDKEKDKQYMQISTQIELMDLKMLSIRDVLWYKQGKIEFNLPVVSFKNYQNQDYEEEKNSNEENFNTNDNETKKDTVIQKVLKKIRKNKK